MRTTEAAAVTACVFVSLYAGHHVGDHVVQSEAVNRAKAIPTDDRLAAGTHPWTGWVACIHHVASYTATQAVALALVWVVAPLTLPGAVAALVTSASTHAVIDRRWLVQIIVRAKRCADWSDGPYLIDQSLHCGVLLVAAVLAASVFTTAGAAATTAVAASVIAVALAVERRWARSAADRVGDPHRL